MWIESHQELRQHPKMKKAARLLGVSHRDMVGMLHFLWWWALDYAPDGNLTGLSPDDIAIDGAGWEGEPDSFIQALVDCRVRPDKWGFIENREDGSMHLHDWQQYAGKLLKERNRRAAHARDVRATEGERAGSSGDTSGSREGRVTVTEGTRDPLPNLTNQPNQPTVPTGGARTADAGAVPTEDKASGSDGKPPKAGGKGKAAGEGKKERQYTSFKAERLAKLAEAIVAVGLKNPKFTSREAKAAGDLMEAGWKPEQIAECIKDIKGRKYLKGDRLAFDQVSCEFLAGFQRMQNWQEWVDAGRPEPDTEISRNGTARSANTRGLNGGAVASEELTEQVSPGLAAKLAGAAHA